MATQAARKYTLTEVDALRAAVTNANMQQFTMWNSGEPVNVTKPPSHEFIENHVRTAMMAGITADEYGAESV